MRRPYSSWAIYLWGIRMSTHTYSDIDFNFNLNPLSNDLAIKTDVESVKQSIRNLLLTEYYERPFQSHIGSQIRSALFEVAYIGDVVLKKTIENCINNFEPRVQIIKIITTQSADEHSLYVSLDFNIKNTTKTNTMELTLEKNR